MATKKDGKIQISARIAVDVRKGMKASQEANGRTWEGEVEKAFRFWLEHGQ